MTDTRDDEGKSAKKQRVRVISEDGVCANTQLLDADSGGSLNIRAYRVNLSVDARDEQKFWKAELYTYFPYLDILADAEVFQKCRYCKQDLPSGWEGQDTMLTNQVKLWREMREAQKKPLRDALDFHHDLIRAREDLATLRIHADEFPLGYMATIIEHYEKAIMEFLGEKQENDEGKET